MSTASIPKLPVATSITGAEWLEIAQLSGAVSPGYVSRRVTAAQLMQLAQFVVPTGPTGVASDTPSGTNNNYTVNGQFSPLIGFVELNPPSNVIITGLQAGFDGQITTISNLSSGGVTVTLNALSAGSLLVNQFRLPTNIVLTQYNSQSFKYSAKIGLWVQL